MRNIAIIYAKWRKNSPASIWLQSKSGAKSIEHFNSQISKFRLQFINNNDTSFHLISFSDNKIRTMDYSNVNNTFNEWPLNEVMGFGNSLSHQPLQKVKNGTGKFHEIVNRYGQSKEELVDKLMQLLCDSEKHWPDAELHRRAPLWGEHLSSICVNMTDAGYGSR